VHVPVPLHAPPHSTNFDRVASAVLAIAVSVIVVSRETVSVC